MKKTNALWIVLNSIFVLVFNAFFFIGGGFQHAGSVWLSYGFIHFAYAMLIIAPRLIHKGKSTAIYGHSVFSILVAYFIMQFVVGTIFILLSLTGLKVALLTQIFIAGFYAVLLVVVLIANQKTAEAEEKRGHEIAYVKNASIRVKGMIDDVIDRKAQKKVEQVYDTIYSSPVKSHPELAQMENHILELIEELDEVISAGNAEEIMASAKTLLSAANERNMKLRMLN